jgi:polyhydroxyalkanoate synthesis regulator phasin
MGWGISFALDSQGRVYCADGCNWRANKDDYNGYPEWPSGRQSVLDYFEGEAHRELDMIRDECPGTAAALKEACGEHIDYAVGQYNRLTNQQKTELHNEMMEKLKNDIVNLEELKKDAYETFLTARKEFKAYQPPTKAPKTRIDELNNIIKPLRMELFMEIAARDYDTMKSELTKAKRDMRLEKMFTLE